MAAAADEDLVAELHDAARPNCGSVMSEMEVDPMKRGVPLFVVFALAVGFTLAGPQSSARAQSFTGKWVHQGPKGSSFIEFMPGEKKVLGPTRGVFHHMILLDDGRLLQGDGHYTFRSIGPNRGWLTLYFADGHVTHEHEHTASDTMLNIRHHGITQVYVRRVEVETKK